MAGSAALPIAPRLINSAVPVPLTEKSLMPEKKVESMAVPVFSRKLLVVAPSPSPEAKLVMRTPESAPLLTTRERALLPAASALTSKPVEIWPLLVMVAETSPVPRLRTTRNVARSSTPVLVSEKATLRASPAGTAGVARYKKDSSKASVGWGWPGCSSSNAEWVISLARPIPAPIRRPCVEDVEHLILARADLLLDFDLGVLDESRCC